MRSRTILRREKLYDLLKANPAGFTYAELADLLGCSVQVARLTVQNLRDHLGEEEKHNIPTVRQGWREPHRIMLIPGFERETKVWSADRLKYAKRLMTTVHAIFSSGVRGTSGRSSDGRTVRELERSARHTVEIMDAATIAATEAAEDAKAS
jgi:hypothetical protein